MSSLPPVAAAVTAEAVAALPNRLRARLDSVAEQARAWPVSREGPVITVRPDDQTTVTLTDPVTGPGDAACSCLLAPRCLHRAAVLSLAPILTDEPAVLSGPGEPVRPSAPDAAAAPSGSGGPSVVSVLDGLSPSDATAASGGAAASDCVGLESEFDGAGSAEANRAGEESGAAGIGPAAAVSGESSSDSAATPPSPAGRPGSMPEGGSGETGGGRRSVVVGEGQRDAAAGLWAVAADVLSAGIQGAGAVAQADLLRAVHRARAAGVHAPALTGIRIVEQLRAARRDEAGFRLAGLTDDVRDLLAACHRLERGAGDALGVARRDYEAVGDLRLHGVFCEPVRAATGHAGAVTYLVDARGGMWVVSDVKPAAPAQAGSLTRASVDLGEVRISHHELARGGLRAINAHASAARRLSHGRARQAVAAAGAGWFDPPLDTLWAAGIEEQIDRWLSGAALAAHERPAAYDLGFLEGIVLGSDRRGLVLGVEGCELAVAVNAAVMDPAFPYVANLRLLGTHAVGLPLRVAGRFTGARRIEGLAFAAPWLAERHGGHVDLGAVSLTRADLPGTAEPAPESGVLGGAASGGAVLGSAVLGSAVPGGAVPGAVRAEPLAPPLHLLRHQLERVVAAGRGALLPGVEHDARRLVAAQMGGAAAVLTGLGAAGVRRTRDVFGRLDPHDAQVLARAWLAAAVYEQAAGREVTRAAWMRS